jgi:hypothetical protein
MRRPNRPGNTHAAIDARPARTFTLAAAGLAAILFQAGAGGPRSLLAQQIADSLFAPPISRPAYAAGTGPTIAVDEGHSNFHTAGGRYRPFAELLRRDGYVVRGLGAPFHPDSLAGIRILVVANALAARNREDWSLPVDSAFTPEEIRSVVEWVRSGGSLFLIADHMPFPGAADSLALAFGVHFTNGFAVDEAAPGGPFVFRRSEGLLADHAITRGRNAEERVDSVATFTGSAFRVEGPATPLLILKEGIVALEPAVAWEFTADTKRSPAGGMWQGALLRAGQGRVVICGEAAMFTAQLAGPNRTPVGMNSPLAPRNAQFLLNLVHWLAGEGGD